MFGMSSEEFWEQDPQLYWSFRTFYLKEKEIEQKANLEQLKYMSWLNGFTTYIACSTSLNNALSKSKKEYPKYEEIFGGEKAKPKTEKEIGLQVQNDFNYWARK